MDSSFGNYIQNCDLSVCPVGQLKVTQDVGSFLGWEVLPGGTSGFPGNAQWVLLVSPCDNPKLPPAPDFQNVFHRVDITNLENHSLEENKGNQYFSKNKIKSIPIFHHLICIISCEENVILHIYNMRKSKALHKGYLKNLLFYLVIWQTGQESF